jgi:hypothetical protein
MIDYWQKRLKGIGKKIGESTHHTVYNYGSGKVVKIPKKRFDFIYSNRQDLEADLKLVNGFFPGFAVATRIAGDENDLHHVIIQRRVKNPVLLTPTTYLSVRKELEKVFDFNRRLIKEHRRSLDILGGTGFISTVGSIFGIGEAHISNILLENRGGKLRPVLVDTELLRLTPSLLSLRDLTVCGLSIVSWVINKIFLARFFGIRNF